MPIGSSRRLKTGKHRSPAIETDHGPDDELTSYLAALAPDNTPTATELTNSFGPGQAYQLHLHPIANEQLKELATKRNMSPQRLATEWILERLALEVDDLIE